LNKDQVAILRTEEKRIENIEKKLIE